MKNASSRKHVVIIPSIAVTFGILFWLLDAALNFFFFRDYLRFMIFERPQTLLESLLTNVSSYALFVRLAFLAACILGGVFAMLFAGKKSRTEQQLAQRAHWIQILNSVSGEIAKRNNLESILRVVIRYLEESFSFALGGITLRSGNEDGTCRHILGARSHPLASRLGLEEGTAIPMDQVLLADPEEAVHARSMRLDAVDSSALSKAQVLSLRRMIQEGLNTAVVVQLATDSIHAGTLYMFFRGKVSFSEAQMSFLDGLAEHVSLAVQNQRLYEKLEASYSQLKEAQGVLMALERMKAMGQMASGIAHDINNTLAPITLYTEALMDGEAGLSEGAKRYLKTIQTAVGDIESVTNRLRCFYNRAGGAELEPVIIERLFDEVIELTRPRWKDIPNRQGISIQIKKDLKGKLAPIYGSESEIREALVNLVFNAVDSMPKGGTITFKARKQDPYLRVEVNDTGVGMNEEQKERCLEPFYSTKGAEGSGLGLSTVYGTIQRHDGEMEIESKTGKGTSVRMLFPLREENQEKRTCKEEDAPLPCLKILCVDDNRTVRDALNEVLSRQGHEVKACEGGEEALEVFRERSGTEKAFDLVITDLGMPHMDGRDVARETKRISFATPVILLSGWGNFMNLNGELPENIDCLLGKPPKMSTLNSAIRRVLSLKANPREW